MEPKYDPDNLFLDVVCQKKKDKRLDKYDKEFLDISNIPTLEVDKEVKGKGMEVEGKGLKILSLNKLLTTLSVLLAQVKAGNSSYKLKKEFRQILSFVPTQ